MSTNLTYGDVTLTNVQTLSFRQNVKRDDTETDLLYHEFTIRVECVAHQSAETLFHGFKGTTAVEAQQELQKRLLQPRKAFEFKVGANVLVAANNNNASSDFDLNNGPHPKTCEIANIAGTRTMRITYEIELAILRGKGPSPGELDAKAQQAVQMQGVLNNRWTAEESLDENLYRTRTIEGKLRVKHIGLNPQSYKLLVIPKLAVGWKRMRARFTTSANGLTMSYSLTDREMASAPPSPATTWNATYTETTTNNAAITKGEVAVSMEGPPDADKRMLLQRCGEVVLQRLPDIQNHKILSDGGEYDGKPVIESAAIIEFLHKNAVEMRVRVRHVSTPTRIHNMVLQHFGRPLALPNYTPKTQVIPAQFDASSPTGIFAMYVQNPYDDYHGLLPTDTGSDYAAEQVQYFQEEPTSPGDSGDPDSGGGEDVETDDKKFVSDDQAKGPYTEWTSMTTALAATGTYAVPFAEQLEDATTDTTTDKPEGQPSVKHISLHKNISRLVVSYTATRDHNKPEFPESPATWENNGITYKKESSKEVELGGRTGAGGIASYRSRQTTYYTAVSPIKKRVDPVQDPSVVKPANVKPGVPEDITPLSGGASNLNGSDEGRAYWKPISPD